MIRGGASLLPDASGGAVALLVMREGRFAGDLGVPEVGESGCTLAGVDLRRRPTEIESWKMLPTGSGSTEALRDLRAGGREREGVGVGSSSLSSSLELGGADPSLSGAPEIISATDDIDEEGDAAGRRGSEVSDAEDWVPDRVRAAGGLDFEGVVVVPRRRGDEGFAEALLALRVIRGVGVPALFADEGVDTAGRDTLAFFADAGVGGGVR